MPHESSNDVISLLPNISRYHTISKEQRIKKWGLGFWFTLWIAIILLVVVLFIFMMTGVSSLWIGILIFLILALVAISIPMLFMDYGEEAINLQPVNIKQNEIEYRRLNRKSDALRHSRSVIRIDNIKGIQVEMVESWTNRGREQTSLGSKAWVLHILLKSGVEEEVIRDPYYVIEAANHIFKAIRF
jgi:hypothetical protein